MVTQLERHRGHDVVCSRCNLQAVEFIDYAKALKESRPELYNKNKCWCLAPTEFYCKDCKEEITLS